MPRPIARTLHRAFCRAGDHQEQSRERDVQCQRRDQPDRVVGRHAGTAGHQDRSRRVGHGLQAAAAAPPGGLNDRAACEGGAPPPYRGDVPFVPGSEGAGTVAAVGPDVPGVRQGDRVAWTGISGCYAEQVIIPADRAVPVPEEIDLETAGAVMLQGMTAHYLATDTYPVAEGDPAVVHAAPGGG